MNPAPQAEWRQPDQRKNDRLYKKPYHIAWTEWIEDLGDISMFDTFEITRECQKVVGEKKDFK